MAYQPGKRRLKTVTEERLFETPHRSPQPTLWAWGDGEWLRAKLGAGKDADGAALVALARARELPVGAAAPGGGEGDDLVGPAADAARH